MKSKIYFLSALILILSVIGTDGKLHGALVIITALIGAFIVCLWWAKRNSWPVDTEFENKESEPQNID